MKQYTADLETTTDENDCRCWAWAVCEIGDITNFVCGINLDDMLEWCKINNNPVLWFHNLKFDSEFIMDRLFRLGYEAKAPNEKLTDKSFSILINDMGTVYSMTICFWKKGKKICKVNIYDSLKLIPNQSVKNIAINFGLEWQKGELDYDRYRAPGHEMTEHEKKYIRSDVTIMALALEIMFDVKPIETDYGLKIPKMKSTIGSSALEFYKTIIGRSKFKYWFPQLTNEMDEDIRKAYRGGFTYSDPRYKNKIIGRFNVLDYNSLYPSVMYYRPLPWGEPLQFFGKYEPNDDYPLFIQSISCQFELKEGHIPTIQLKNSGRYVDTEYLTTSVWKDKNGTEHDELATLALTNMDLELLFKHYNVYNIEYNGGYMFKSTTALFKKYIDHWTKIKTDSKINGNGSMYAISKLFLNSLYGKMGSNPKCVNKIPYLDEETDRVKFRLSEESTKKTIYIPCAVFITSWARYTTITQAQHPDVYPHFMYADTDSLHLNGRKLPPGLDIDETRLGALDHEFVGFKAKFLGQKAYLEYGMKLKDYQSNKWKKDENGNRKHKAFKKVTVAGMPKNCHQHVNFGNFYIGAPPFPGKLRAKRCRGGVILYSDVFTFKERLTK